jgi:hypothetical protein
MLLNIIYFNRYFDKNRLKALILWSLTNAGEKTTIDLVEELKNLGFSYATKAGLSLGIDDLKIPPTKSQLILEAETRVLSSQKEYEIGNVTIVEKFQQLIDIWHRTSELLKQNVIEHFGSTDVLNPVYMMAFSGARGNISQVRQLVGMRGLMADPQGQILDFPIRSNFREGLTLTEYIISCYGARKGLVDTALRTANSGYLTRRLIDVAQHIIVRRIDCGTENGIVITDMKDGKKILFSLKKRLVGRVLAKSIQNVAKRNEAISPALSLKIVCQTNQVVVRSPLTCEAKKSICQLCYGWSLAHGNLVSIGEAVGILAAQSIGEPGTQLTMRTFHTGGVFSGDVMQEIRSPFSGIVTFSNPLQGILIRTLHGKIAFLTKTEGELILTNSFNAETIKYNIPSSTVLFIRQFERVQEKQLLAEYSSVVTNSNEGIQEKYNVNSTVEGETYFENVFLVVRSGKEGDIIKTALKFGSMWILSGKLYQSPIRSNLFIKPGDLVDTNSIFNESILVTPYTGFLEKQDFRKKKYKFLTKKRNTFNENKIVFKNLTKTNSFFENNHQLNKLNDKFSLNENFFEIKFKNIQYKKLGYFLSLNNSKNNQFFLICSLKKNNIFLKDLYLYWFSTTEQNQKIVTFFDSNFSTTEKGFIFHMKEKVYQFNKKNIISKNFSFSSTIIKKNIQPFILINKQGNKKKIFSKENIYHESSPFNFFEKRTKINYKKNPGVEDLEKIFFNKTNLPLSSYNKSKIRTNSFNSKIFSHLIKSLNKTQEQNKIQNLEVSCGWIFISQKYSQIFSVNKELITPTYKTNIEGFNQTSIYKKSLSKKNCFYYFLNKNHLVKSRYIKNQLFRYNKFHNYKDHFWKYQDRINKKSSKSFFEETKHFENSIFDSLNFETLKIIRNKIYLKNFEFRNLFLVEIQKTDESPRFNEKKEKKKIQKLLHFQKELKDFDLELFKNNKQKITKLKLPYPNIDAKIKKEHFEFDKSRASIAPLTISLFYPKNCSFKKGQLKIQSGQQLIFSSTRKIQSLNHLFTETTSTIKHQNNVFVTKTRTVIEQNTFSLNSFLSPFQGEITTIKSNFIEKEKTLLLTNNDKISFLNNQKNLLLKIGQVLRYGDPIFQKIGSTESGQIIQIDHKKITLRKAQPILFSSQGIFHVDNGEIIEKNSPLITLFYRKLKTEDIVQGIPKIEELFEARQAKEGEPLQDSLHNKLTLFFNTFKEQYPSQQAARKSIEKIQQILVNNVQKVYQSQGVSIADKHIEIIVRQMTTKVKITESGRTGLLRGELIDLERVELINLGIEGDNEIAKRGLDVEKAEYEPIILGITKAALETESFISASSFQETTRILSRAAIARKTDFLRGLKENVILGHLIPAGTGFSLSFDANLKKSNILKKVFWYSYKDIITKYSIKN